MACMHFETIFVRKKIVHFSFRQRIGPNAAFRVLFCMFSVLKKLLNYVAYCAAKFLLCEKFCTFFHSFPLWTDIARMNFKVSPAKETLCTFFFACCLGAQNIAYLFFVRCVLC